LVEALGGKPTAAAGFAIGLERLVELLSADSPPPQARDRPQIYVVVLDDADPIEGMTLAERLRDRGLLVLCHCGAGNLAAQLRRADRIGAKYAVILGGDEAKTRSVTVKSLRGTDAQERVPLTEAGDYLSRKLSDKTTLRSSSRDGESDQSD
jgi:histidyl-tRNA synthetase